MAESVAVTFTPSGRRGEVTPGTTVLDAGRALGVDIDSVCGGRGICGRCQITIGSQVGIDADPARLSPPGGVESSYRGRRPLPAGHRLACATHILQDVVIDVPPDSQVHRQVVRKQAQISDLVVDPVVRLHYVVVDSPDLHRQDSDLTRLLHALESQWELTDLHVPAAVLADLQSALRQGEWAVTVAVHDGSSITGVWPGFHDRALGVAIDVGSTTLAGHLCDLFTGDILASEGMMNPQIRFGEDLMSRVSYVMMNQDGADGLTETIGHALDELVNRLLDHAGAQPGDLLEVVLVGNPIMHHLFLGLDPRPLGVAPFALASDQAVRSRAGRVGISAHPDAPVYVLPCVAGHVGADAAGAMLSEGPHRGGSIQLLVDVGTNAEIVLGNDQRLLAASSPTGPAFEGAEISHGQRAAPGAIERVRIDPRTLEPRFKVIGVELWSDEAGFADAIAKTGVTGICGSGIIEAVVELALAGVLSADGRILEGDFSRLGQQGRTGFYLVQDEPNRIVITQTDIRAIQLAKAALYAGIRLLMDHLNLEQVDEIRLSGAFGSHIDPVYAMALGMIPDCDLDHVRSAGNAAGNGAVMALLSGSARREVEDLVRQVEKIETAVEPRFQEHFVEAMAIPHATHSFPHLTTQMDLSQIPPAGQHRPARRRKGLSVPSPRLRSQI